MLISVQNLPVSALALPAIKSVIFYKKNNKMKTSAGKSARCFLIRTDKIWKLVNRLRDSFDKPIGGERILIVANK
ncbi:MAG: hypothetical protein ACXV8O_12610 [Methylobacter sp.]